MGSPIVVSAAAQHASQVAHGQPLKRVVSTATLPIAWGSDEPVRPAPQIVLSSAVSLVEGRPVATGLEIIVLAYPWRDIQRRIEADPDFLYRGLTSRQLEEIVAGAYDARGFKVTLTPPRNDGGRYVIAVEEAMGITIFDEVKCYGPDYKVGVDVLYKLHSVLELEGNVSKGFVSTTSSFTSGVYERFGHLMPARLDLRNGDQLREFIRQSADRAS
jgi:Restriction endonuclease